MVTFTRVRSSAIARNVLHGLQVPSGSNNAITRLHTVYVDDDPIQSHTIRDWLASHPKIALPIILTLLGTLTYAIFDPIRSLMIQGKIEEWFDFRGILLPRYNDVVSRVTPRERSLSMAQSKHIRPHIHWK